jgi:hypothetical protein
MSPEQATGAAQLDGRSDLYSLGVVGYRMLAGKLPFVAPTTRGVLTQHVFTPPEPLAAYVPVPIGLSDAVMRCLAKQPDDRWQTADELLAALLGGTPSPGAPVLAMSPPVGVAAVPLPKSPPRRAARRGWSLVLVLSFAVAALGAAGWFAARWNEVRHREAAATAAASSYQAAALAAVSAYQQTAESLHVMVERFRQGTLTGAQYRAAASSLRRAAEARLDARYGHVLSDSAIRPTALRTRVATALRATGSAALPSAVLGLQESATSGCAMQRRDSAVVLRDGARRDNCWWNAAAGQADSLYGAPVEYLMSFQVTGARPAGSGLGLAWCGAGPRCRVLWLWLEGRVEWGTHASGGGLDALQLGRLVRLARGDHRLRVRFEGGGLKVWMDGGLVLARAQGEEAATLRRPGDLRVVVQNTAIALPGREALTVVGMRQ